MWFNLISIHKCFSRLELSLFNIIICSVICCNFIVHVCRGVSVYMGGFNFSLLPPFDLCRRTLLSSQQSLMHRKQCLQECCSLIMLIYNCLYLKSDKSKYIIIQLLVGIFIFKQRVDWGRFNILNVLVLSNISQCNLILQSFSSKMYHCLSPLNQFRSDCAI